MSMSEETKANLAIGAVTALFWLPALIAGAYWLVTGRSLLTLLGG